MCYDESMTQTTTKSLWINDNGRVSCPDHGGHYLRCAITDDTPTDQPRYSMPYYIDTPLGSWLLVDADMRADAAAERVDLPGCEGC